MQDDGHPGIPQECTGGCQGLLTNEVDVGWDSRDRENDAPLPLATGGGFPETGSNGSLGQENGDEWERGEGWEVREAHVNGRSGHWVLDVGGTGWEAGCYLSLMGLWRTTGVLRHPSLLPLKTESLPCTLERL